MLALPAHPATGRVGSIINFASLLSFQGGLTVPAYAASKGAVAQLTKSLANEWAARGINVNAIAPGYVETDMNAALLADADRLASISARIPAGRVSACVIWVISLVCLITIIFLSRCSFRHPWLFAGISLPISSHSSPFPSLPILAR